MLGGTTGHDSWIGHTPFHLRLAQIIPQFLIGTGTRIRGVLKVAAMALAAASIALLVAGGASCNLIGSQMQRSYAILGFHAVWRRRVRQFTTLRLEADRPVTVTRRAVGAALTTTRLARDELLVQPS